MQQIPIRPARCRRCTKRFSSRPSARRQLAKTASSIAILPGARRRRKGAMAPDADAGKSTKRADPFSPLTSELLQAGDYHEVYVLSGDRADVTPAVYLHAAPGAVCRP